MTNFEEGTVGDTLMRMRGIWHDVIKLYELDGTHMGDDTIAGSGTPGASPFENLVYLDFDGVVMTLTNVHIKGRPLVAKTFTGKLKDGVLVFDPLGPGAYENIGMSGGQGILTFNARAIEPACSTYMEPDFIMMIDDETRVRHTVLYRRGEATRTLTAKGKRLSHDPSSRHMLDPRGANGPVHEEPFITNIWAED